VPPVRKKPDHPAKTDGFDRVPPQAIEAERAVLGALLADGEAINKVLDMLGEESFYREAHRKSSRRWSPLREGRRSTWLPCGRDEEARVARGAPGGSPHVAHGRGGDLGDVTYPRGSCSKSISGG
jgi:hypothetical protein